MLLRWLLPALLIAIIVQGVHSRSYHRHKHKSKSNRYESSSSTKNSGKVYESHSGGPGGPGGGRKSGFGSVSSMAKTGCFWRAVGCRQKKELGDWDQLDCDDMDTQKCCAYECTSKVEALERMAEEERIRKEAEARANLELLEVLESKKNELLQQLEDAKARALEANISILSPPEIDLKDVEALAAVPQDARDEMDTLVQVAGAIVDSEADVDPEVKADLEEIVLNDIVEATEDAAKKDIERKRSILGGRIHLVNGDADDFKSDPAAAVSNIKKVAKARDTVVGVDALQPIKRLHHGDPFKNEEKSLLRQSTNLGRGDMLMEMVSGRGKKQVADESKKEASEIDLLDGWDEDEELDLDDEFGDFLRDEMER